MTDNSKEKSLRYLMFKGEEDKFCMWHLKFLARARVKGYKMTLTGELPIPPASETLASRDEEVKKKLRIKTQNKNQT